MSAAIPLTSADFKDKVENSNLPVIIDFWAEWCGPCKAMNPVLEEISQEYEGKLSIYKVNVDEEGALASQFGVMSIPTLVLFKNGQEVDRMTGAGPKPNIIKFFEGHI